jgi:Leucine-rich repeat (LRR) protein
VSFLHLKDTVSTIFLGENDITKVPPSFFKSFRRLIWLDLDKNHIKNVDPGAFPPSLTTLSLGHNHFTNFPLALTDSLPDLTWYSLRGNYIEAIPLEPFHVLRQLDKLDLGENFLTLIPPVMFNGTLTVNDLNLEYNYIERLEASAFISLSPRRLYLGHNRISFVDDATFNGVDRQVELVDLEANKLQNVSRGFSSLKKLRYLYLSKNNISELSLEVFDSTLCTSLRAMRVAYNNLKAYPSEVLKKCSNMSHLDLGYNMISAISDSDMRQACTNLDTLILRGNQIQILEPRVFRDCNRLRELSLSYNKIDRIDAEAFRDVGDSLESLEISFGLDPKMTRFPGVGLRPLVKLLWLAMDNNHIDEIGETDLYSLGELQYLNLESNRLTSIPKHMLHKNVHKKLLDVRLSYNKLKVLASSTFASLSTLQTVTMTGNHLINVERLAFHDLPNLVAVLLTQNHLRMVSARAFSKLASLQRLELQHNRLREFGLGSFENCSNDLMSPMTLNISYNLLEGLSPAPIAKNHVPPFIHVIDASHNVLTRIPMGFLEQAAPALRTLDLSYNRITGIDGYDLKSLVSLQELKLAANHVIDLHKAALRHLTGLQILDLSQNRIEVLQFGQFSGLTGLRRVNLAQNR